MNTSEIAKKLGSRGGKATSKKYGKKHYQKLAENMNRKKKLKYLEFEDQGQIQDLRDKDEIDKSGATE